MKDALKDYKKLIKQIEKSDDEVLALLNPDDELEEDEYDDELPPDYVLKPIEVTPEEPKKREKRIGALIFFIVCAFMCFLYALIFDKAYNDFRPIPVIVGGLFLIIGVIVF